VSTATIAAEVADADRERRRAPKVAAGASVLIRRGPEAGQEGVVIQADSFKALVRSHGKASWLPIISLTVV
jgi:peptidyl-tRNA hydrolase